MRRKEINRWSGDQRQLRVLKDIRANSKNKKFNHYWMLMPHLKGLQCVSNYSIYSFIFTDDGLTVALVSDMISIET